MAVGIAATGRSQPARRLYNYVVTNTGNVPLTGVTVGDDQLGAVAQSMRHRCARRNGDWCAALRGAGGRHPGDAGEHGQRQTKTAAGAAVTGFPRRRRDRRRAQVTVQPDRASANVGEVRHLRLPSIHNLGDVPLSGVTLADNRIGAIRAQHDGAGVRAPLPRAAPPVDRRPTGPLVTAYGDRHAGRRRGHATGGASVSLSGTAALAVSVSKPASASVATTVQYTYQIHQHRAGALPATSLRAIRCSGPIVLASGSAGPEHHGGGRSPSSRRSCPTRSPTR